MGPVRAITFTGDDGLTHSGILVDASSSEGLVIYREQTHVTDDDGHLVEQWVDFDDISFGWTSSER